MRNKHTIWRVVYGGKMGMPPNGARTVSDVRQLFLEQLRTRTHTLAALCRQHGISRKTAYKWLQRFQQAGPPGLHDRSRRPHHSPGRTDSCLEQTIIQTHQRFHWGAAKVHAYLRDQNLPVPSITTVQAILTRHHLVATPRPPAEP